MTHEEFLLHYGVKGMKWGTRKSRLTDRVLNRRMYKQTKKDLGGKKADKDAVDIAFNKKINSKLRKKYNAKSKRAAEEREVAAKDVKRMKREKSEAKRTHERTVKQLEKQKEQARFNFDTATEAKIGAQLRVLDQIHKDSLRNYDAGIQERNWDAQYTPRKPKYRKTK